MRAALYKSLEAGFLAYLSYILVVLFIIIFTLESVPELGSHESLFRLVDHGILILFTLEYFLRIWAAPRRSKYIFSFYGIIDLIAIVPIFLITGVLDVTVIRILRFLRIFKIFKSRRLNTSLVRLKKAMSSIKSELFVFTILIIIMMYIAAVGIYTFEHEAQPELFASIPASLWWALTTLSTVGYGDAYPITAGGKFFTAFVLYIGLGTVAVPTGLIAAALTNLKKDEKDSEV